MVARTYTLPLGRQMRTGAHAGRRCLLWRHRRRRDSRYWPHLLTHAAGGFVVSRVRNETQRYTTALKSAGQSSIGLSHSIVARVIEIVVSKGSDLRVPLSPKPKNSRKIGSQLVARGDYHCGSHLGRGIAVYRRVSVLTCGNTLGSYQSDCKLSITRKGFPRRDPVTGCAAYRFVEPMRINAEDPASTAATAVSTSSPSAMAFPPATQARYISRGTFETKAR